MATLEAGLTRDEAFALLQEHNKDLFHIEHAETVEQTMRYFAREYDPRTRSFGASWACCHDLDWEEHDDEPELHTIYAAKDIEPPAARPSSSAPSRATPPTSTRSCRSPSCRWRRSCSPPKN